ncbi:hypothetical protein BDB00DRAFT_338296 [Zychaea mexicana]|uniref:uncharacterized protein n=1 Tax=Zychaea mexicana TaxID=64656 RepID=UPI0022FE9B8A|nr:uncharacterized protein BDB00DRAFT_338296 [Zychaea mexicana]KAI9466449.1 hypothetical protein BDB00DRAFT_338296 [Zychaea mexicana]
MTSIAKRQLLPYLRQSKIAPTGCNLARSTYTTSSFQRSSSIGFTNYTYNTKIFGQNALAYRPLETPLACRTITLTTRRLYSSPSSAAAEKQQQQQQESGDNTTDSTNTANPPAKQQSRLGQLFEKSKALVVFYKNGLKELWANQKAAKALKQQVTEQGYQLTRSEYQLVSDLRSLH